MKSHRNSIKITSYLKTMELSLNFNRRTINVLNWASHSDMETSSNSIIRISINQP